MTSQMAPDDRIILTPGELGASKLNPGGIKALVPLTQYGRPRAPCALEPIGRNVKVAGPASLCDHPGNRYCGRRTWGP